jgi:hypothetical protein
VRLEGLGKFKKFILFGTRKDDLPACSIVLQPITLPRASFHCIMLSNFNLSNFMSESEIVKLVRSKMAKSVFI